MEIHINRRQLALISASCFFLPSACVLINQQELNGGLNIYFPENKNPDHPSFEVFYALSCLVTFRDHLDASLAKDIYNCFQTEPWGSQHISSCYQKISQILLQHSKARTPHYSEYFSHLNEGEKWFVSHLLTTWYLGVYYHQERPATRLTFHQSLMLECASQFRGMPPLTPRSYGSWSSPVVSG